MIQDEQLSGPGQQSKWKRCGSRRCGAARRFVRSVRPLSKFSRHRRVRFPRSSAVSGAAIPTSGDTPYPFGESQGELYWSATTSTIGSQDSDQLYFLEAHSRNTLGFKSSSDSVGYDNWKFPFLDPKDFNALDSFASEHNPRDTKILPHFLGQPIICCPESRLR